MAKFVAGCVCLLFSLPLLWVNESRNARMESLLSWGRKQCRTVPGKTIGEDNRNWLVHIQGEDTRSTEGVSDKQFDVAFQYDCVRLRTTVEVFQHIEHESRKRRDLLGGRKETVTTYTYTQEWSSYWHESNNFKDKSLQNIRPDGVLLGARFYRCRRVELGEAFALTDDLVDQLSAFESAAHRLGPTVTLKDGTTVFTKASDGCFYHCREDGEEVEGNRRIGDARVRFEYVPDGPVSVMALQVEPQKKGKETFLAYRLINRGFCGMSMEEEKHELITMAKKSKEAIGAEAQVGPGFLWCLCCACNLVSMCFAHLLMPEIYHVFPGSVDKSECFRRIQATSHAVVWGLRLLGWLMMFWGLFALFSPLLALVRVIPWLGPILSDLGGWLIWVLCLLVTLAFSSMTICLAYLFFHPLRALVYLAVFVAVVAVPLAVAAAVGT